MLLTVPDGKPQMRELCKISLGYIWLDREGRDLRTDTNNKNYVYRYSKKSKHSKNESKEPWSHTGILYKRGGRILHKSM
jgi:hypothetical protein